MHDFHGPLLGRRRFKTLLNVSLLVMIACFSEGPEQFNVHIQNEGLIGVFSVMRVLCIFIMRVTLKVCVCRMGLLCAKLFVLATMHTAHCTVNTAHYFSLRQFRFEAGVA